MFDVLQFPIVILYKYHCPVNIVLEIIYHLNCHFTGDSQVRVNSYGVTWSVEYPYGTITVVIIKIQNVSILSCLFLSYVERALVWSDNSYHAQLIFFVVDIILSYHTSHDTTPHHITSHHITSHHIIPYHHISCYVILHGLSYLMFLNIVSDLIFTNIVSVFTCVVEQ